MFDEVKSLLDLEASHAGRIKRITDPLNAATGIVDDSTASSASYWQRQEGPISALISLYEVLLGEDTSADLSINGILDIGLSSVAIAGGFSVTGGTINLDGIQFSSEAITSMGGGSISLDDATFQSVIATAISANTLDAPVLRNTDTAISAVSTAKKMIETDTTSYALMLLRNAFTSSQYASELQGNLEFWGDETGNPDTEPRMVMTRGGKLLIGAVNTLAAAYDDRGDITIWNKNGSVTHTDIAAVSDPDSIRHTELRLKAVAVDASSVDHVSEIRIISEAILTTDEIEFLIDGVEIGNINSSGLNFDNVNAESVLAQNGASYVKLDSASTPMVKLHTATMDAFFRGANYLDFYWESMHLVSPHGFAITDADGEASEASFVVEKYDNRAAAFFYDASSLLPSGLNIGPTTVGNSVLRLTGTGTNAAALLLESGFWHFSDNGAFMTSESGPSALGSTNLGAHIIPMIDTGATDSNDSSIPTTLAASFEEINGATVMAVDATANKRVTIWTYNDNASTWYIAATSTN